MSDSWMMYRRKKLPENDILLAIRSGHSSRFFDAMNVKNW